MVFKLHPQSEERKRTAVTLIKYLLADILKDAIGCTVTCSLWSYLLFVVDLLLLYVVGERVRPHKRFRVVLLHEPSIERPNASLHQGPPGDTGHPSYPGYNLLFYSKRLLAP